MPLQTPAVTFGESSLRPQGPPPPLTPLRYQSLVPYSPSECDPTPVKAITPAKRPAPAESEGSVAKRLNSTVLAPYLDRIRRGDEERERLCQLNSELMTMNQRQRKQLAGESEDSGYASAEGQQLLLQAPESHGTKRELPPVSPMKIGIRETGGDEHTVEGHLIYLANQILEELDKTVANETIHLCGLGPLKIMDSQPDKVLDLAHQKLHTWPYKSVSMCWRRLYEDAALSKAALMLREEAERIRETASFKRRRLSDPSYDAEQIESGWMTELVTTLDKGITLTGSPGRAAVFEPLFQQFENLLKDQSSGDIPITMNIPRRKELETEFPIVRANKAMDFEAFQLHLDQKTIPMIVPATMVSWPAVSHWQNPTYLMRVTLGGRRLVPVEIGKSYLDDSWSQKMMPFREFMTDFLLPEEPKEVGYLAQHDLFAQIPALKNDITIPDYCYTSPPPPKGAAARTAGLASAPRLDEPLLNAWLGPRGTKTPLHTDPYHNILCQVVGYKYVRLYAPDQSQKLYPCDPDANGLDMSNTSQVDVGLFRTKGTYAARDLEDKFPLFKEAKFVEGILKPGECLYVPLGWWHYVKSLTTSFSVSFWWN